MRELCPKVNGLRSAHRPKVDLATEASARNKPKRSLRAATHTVFRAPVAGSAANTDAS